MIEIINKDCRVALAEMPARSVHCCVTSPPYFGLRDYGADGQIGLEPTPDDYVAEMVAVFREVRRVLRDDGTLWLNLGDSYARPLGKGGSGPGGKNREWYGDNYGAARTADVPPGLKPKDLIGIPWRVAFALQADGWYLRQDIIWHKPNPMPESVRDRCTKAHEYIFLFAKNERYYFDSTAMQEPADEGDTRNRRSVWTVTTKPFKEAHFATFPPDLIEPCVLAGCPSGGGVVLDPFFGAGTTGVVAQRHGRNAIGIELNPAYVEIARRRLGLYDLTTNTGIFS